MMPSCAISLVFLTLLFAMHCSANAFCIEESPEPICLNFHNESRTWRDAKLACDNRSTILVEPRISSHQQFLSSKAKELGGEWWIGGSDNTTEGTFLWMTSFSLVRGDVYWHNHTQQRNSNLTNCMTIREGKWDVIQCSERRPYICQKAKPQNGASFNEAGARHYLLVFSILGFTSML